MVAPSTNNGVQDVRRVEDRAAFAAYDVGFVMEVHGVGRRRMRLLVGGRARGGSRTHGELVDGMSSRKKEVWVYEPWLCWLWKFGVSCELFGAICFESQKRCDFDEIREEEEEENLEDLDLYLYFTN